MFHFKSDRKLPFYLLAGPSIAYHLTYYMIYSITKEALLWNMNYHVSPPLPSSPHNNNLSTNETRNILNELKCSLYAHIITDIVLYPFQTILYRYFSYYLKTKTCLFFFSRLFLQGTRTLIDNVDGRTAVIPLISNYESVSDCYQSIVADEGTAGLFRGFGALLLQYTIQTSLIHFANYCLNTLFNIG